MSRPPEVEPARRLSEDEAHGLLARAAEIDARLPVTVSLEELRRSATAAGISHEAFEQATAELRAGKIGPRSGRITIGAALVQSGQVALAATLVLAAFRTPGYPGWWIAQLLGTACAVYGAYKAVGAAGRWLGGLRGRPLSAEETSLNDRDSLPRGGVSMAVRVLRLHPTPIPCPRP